MRALVVDDSQDSRDILSLLLNDFGFDVCQASDGQEGLDVLRTKGPVDVVLVDLYMPHLDGLGFVQAIRRDKGHDALPIMMVTTETEQAEVERALQAGANEYLMKPFSKDMLRDKLTLLKVL